MHAQVYPPATDRFKKCIKEGGVYIFLYFRARSSGNNYKPIANDQMLVFSKWTKIEEVISVPPAFPVYVYSLASMEELQARIDKREQFTGKAPENIKNTLYNSVS
jgi:replication factor A1